MGLARTLAQGVEGVTFCCPEQSGPLLPPRGAQLVHGRDSGGDTGLLSRLHGGLHPYDELQLAAALPNCGAHIGLRSNITVSVGGLAGQVEGA